MAVEVVMPRLGWTMEVGQLAEWLKQDGEPVRAGELLFTVETDKALNEVEALDSGILRIPPDAPAAGVDVPVGAMLAYLLQPGEAVPWETSPAEVALQPVAPQQADVPATTLSTPAPQPETGVEQQAISPRARRVAAELKVDWTTARGSGSSGRIVERDVRALAAHAATAQPPRATPLARRVAAQLGVDLHELAASADGKRISRADVEAAGAKPAPQAPPPSAPTSPEPVVQGAPMSAMRRIIAQRMGESANTTAPVTLTTEADASELVQLRARIAGEIPAMERAPSYTDLIMRLVALALRDHPALNASLANNTIVHHQDIHIGIAVDTERGLVVPVVRSADHKSVNQIAAASAALIAQARLGKSAPDDLRGGTFTITNLGMYDIDAFTPIINLPECAILGVGRIVARPYVIDEVAETIVVRKLVALSLTFDHRVVDGAPAARFLQQVKHFVERPYAWITR